MSTYDDELTLIEQTFTSDNIGNQIPSEVKTTILANENSVTRNEFYNASNNGLHPSKVFLIHAYEYNNQQIVEFENERFVVIRTYKTGFEEIELTCKRMIGND